MLIKTNYTTAIVYLPVEIMENSFHGCFSSESFKESLKKSIHATLHMILRSVHVSTNIWDYATRYDETNLGTSKTALSNVLNPKRKTLLIQNFRVCHYTNFIKKNSVR